MVKVPHVYASPELHFSVSMLFPEFAVGQEQSYKYKQNKAKTSRGHISALYSTSNPWKTSQPQIESLRNFTYTIQYKQPLKQY